MFQMKEQEKTLIKQTNFNVMKQTKTLMKQKNK